MIEKYFKQKEDAKSIEDRRAKKVRVMYEYGEGNVGKSDE